MSPYCALNRIDVQARIKDGGMRRRKGGATLNLDISISTGLKMILLTSWPRS
jgi:hypothetical protein